MDPKLFTRLAIASAAHAAAVTTLVKFPSRPVPQTLVQRVDDANAEVQAIALELAPGKDGRRSRKGRDLVETPDATAPQSSNGIANEVATGETP